MLHQFEITPKAEHRTNGTLLTPRMKVIVTTKYLDPFANGAKEVIEEYERVWDFDYRKALANKGWFDIERID